MTIDAKKDLTPGPWTGLVTRTRPLLTNKPATTGHSDAFPPKRRLLTSQSPAMLGPGRQKHPPPPPRRPWFSASTPKGPVPGGARNLGRKSCSTGCLSVLSCPGLTSSAPPTSGSRPRQRSSLPDVPHWHSTPDRYRLTHTHVFPPPPPNNTPRDARWATTDQ